MNAAYFINEKLFLAFMLINELLRKIKLGSVEAVVVVVSRVWMPD